MNHICWKKMRDVTGGGEYFPSASNIVIFHPLAILNQGDS
jgi:hypothetical protein